MYRIMLGEEDMSTKKLENKVNYMSKVITTAIRTVNTDKTRSNGI